MVADLDLFALGRFGLVHGVVAGIGVFHAALADFVGDLSVGVLVMWKWNDLWQV